MSFSVGIVGLPNTGKSTLFKALTKKQVDIADYPFTTIEPNIGIVPVPDERLEKIASVVHPQKTTETIIEFVDIAGLIKNAHKGEGLGNQFLSHIRNCDTIVEVVRAFENPNIEHVGGEINPETDIEVIRSELLMKDLETLERATEKTTAKKLELLERIKDALSENKLIAELSLTKEEKLEIKEYQFLTAKPTLYLLNVDGKSSCPELHFKHLVMDLKDEEGISELSESETKELGMQSQLDQLILACYNVLDLITFFTITGGKETRAWTLKRDSDVIAAAGRVHTDFAEKFVRAEVIPWQELVKAGSWAKAKELGLLKTAGREYIVQNGDILEFKI